MIEKASQIFPDRPIRRPNGAEECSHGWSEAQPVECGEFMERPRQGPRKCTRQSKAIYA
jgi:hypothetical protein